MRACRCLLHCTVRQARFAMLQYFYQPGMAFMQPIISGGDVRMPRMHLTGIVLLTRGTTCHGR